MPRAGGSLIVALIVGLAVAGKLSAQTTVSLTSSSSLYAPILSFNGGNLVDTYDAGKSGLDLSKQSGLNGSSSNWDLVGNSSLAVIQLGRDATSTYFRIRLADYKASGNSGSAVVLLSNGTTTYGLGAMIGTGNSDGVYFVSPTAGTTLTASFAYGTPTQLTTTGVNYSTVASIDSGAASISTGGDAFLTFSVVNTALTAAGGFAVTNATRVTVFTNTNSSWNGQINGDYLSFGATAAVATNPLEFGAAAVPEPATWVSTGAMVFACGGLIWWRRRKAGAAS